LIFSIHVGNAHQNPYVVGISHPTDTKNFNENQIGFLHQF